MTNDTTTPALTDEQIIERLAVEVMGWHKDVRDSGRSMWVNSENYGMGYTENYLNKGSGSMDFAWNPLTDWNHTMEVVVQLRKLDLPSGCIHIRAIQNGAWEVRFKTTVKGRVSNKSLARAVCLAALAAATSTKQ